MIHPAFLRRPARPSGSSWAPLAIGLSSALVVVAMVAMALVARASSDVHRRAQVVAEEIRASSEEMSAFKWRTNTEVLTGTANLSTSGALVTEGAKILSQLSDKAARLEKLQPGEETRRLAADAEQLIAGSVQALGATQSSAAHSKASLTRIQDQFQPILDRMDREAQLVAKHQQQVATQSLRWWLWASIGSMLLGVGLLGVLGWRMASLQRRSLMAEEKRAMERRSEMRIRALVEDSSDVVTVLDRDLHVRWQAASVRGLLGLEPGSLVETPIAAIAHPDDQPLFESFLRATAHGKADTLRARLRHADGRWLHVEIVARQRFSDPAVGGLVLNMRDVSDRIAIENELRYQAFHDALTGLANRALLEDRLRHALAAGLRTPRRLAVLFIDLDDFKLINDSLGHNAGDLVLQRVAARIDPIVRPTDTAARLGGDEFAVLIDDLDNDKDAEDIARRILAVLRDDLVVEGRELTVSASIGISVSDGSIQADELLRNADTAMYAAKASGKNSMQAFQPSMRRSTVERFELRTELPRALEQQEFYLDYQPIVSLDTGQIAGVEALVRWQHPTRGHLAPDRFVGLAEETGLIVPLGSWILEQACAQARQWEVAVRQRASIYISVNVSIRQLREDDFPDTVANILTRTTLTPRLLVLELTEGLLADDRDLIMRQLQAIKRLGARVAIDDFGTGYSALSHLQRFPADILKVDKSFIDQLSSDDLQNTNLVQGIINLGESLHLDVIAEGIEEPRQADQLHAIRTRFGQGFLFSKPTRPSAILTILEETRSTRTRTQPATTVSQETIEELESPTDTIRGT